MNRQRIILIIIGLVITTLTVAGFGKEVFARTRSGGSRSMGSGPHRAPYTPPPNVLPPPMPPRFPHEWFAKDVVKSFNKNGLEVERVKLVTEADYSPLPAKAKEVTKFSIPSLGKEVGGYILSFEKKDELEKMKKHFLELNEKGELYTWSFVKDNILLVLTGSIPEEKAKQYKSALNDLAK